MGTRHLIVVVKDKEIKVANYGQWDGYPSEQGVNILRILKEKQTELKDKVRNCSWITESDYKELLLDAGAVSTEGLTTVDTIESIKKFNESTKQLSRDLGYKILEIIITNEAKVKLKDSQTFASDSLFCEWCYVIDFDKNTFEIYKGLNKEPLSIKDRFFYLQNDSEKYKPVKLLKEYLLDELPTEEDFISKLEPKE